MAKKNTSPENDFLLLLFFLERREKKKKNRSHPKLPAQQRVKIVE